MKTNTPIRICGMILLLSLISCEEGQNHPSAKERLPNLVIIYCDDLGYGDIGPYGNTVHRTPHLDRMAEEGVLMKDFYVTSGVCTPSRSSLMTACYSQRIDMHVNARPPGSVGRQVLFPRAHKGLHPDEFTIAEMLKAKGYATACIGKWHLGDQAEFLPTQQGFDEYYGIPYSNDMNRDFCPLPLMRNETVIEAPVDQHTITERYTTEAIQFMESHQEGPFFLYLPHAMTHNPLHAGEEFRGKSANGIYGDAVEEIDASTGRILDFLRESGLDQHTLVMFSSDNGAAKPFGGSNLPLSGWKGSTMEGGMRVPGIFWWPGTLEPRVVPHAMATTMDMLPTFAHIIGTSLPTERTLDGHNIYDLLTGATSKSPYEVFYYYQLEQLQAIRKGPWKLRLAQDSVYENIHRATFKEGYALALFHLEKDIKETHNIAEDHPEMVAELQAEAEKARRMLGDLGQQGKEVRPAALVQNPIAQLMKQ